MSSLKVVLIGTAVHMAVEESLRAEYQIVESDDPNLVGHTFTHEFRRTRPPGYLLTPRTYPAKDYLLTPRTYPAKDYQLTESWLSELPRPEPEPPSSRPAGLLTRPEWRHCLGLSQPARRF